MLGSRSLRSHIAILDLDSLERLAGLAKRGSSGESDRILDLDTLERLADLATRGSSA